MKRFLFIGHDASRSGAPFVLLYLLKWLNANHPQCRVDLLLLSGGELEAEYRKVADVHVLPTFERGSLVRRTIRRIRGRLNEDHRLRTRGLSHFQREYDAVIGNTVVALRHLSLFKKRGYRTVIWLHELDRAVEALGLTAELKASSTYVDRFIVGSDAVAAMLRRLRISKPIDRVYEFSPRGAAADIDTSTVRSEIGLSVDAFIVGACGTIESRKGPDLFVELADKLLDDHPEFCFLWIARREAEADPMYRKMVEAIGSSHLAGRVQIVRSAESPEKLLAALDVFVLTSREDPFPLVCLEAANLGKPVVCFADAGGMPEFIESDSGFVVPYLDIETMAEKIALLYNDPGLLSQMGKAAAVKVRERFDISVSAPKILKIIEDFRKE